MRAVEAARIYPQQSVTLLEDIVCGHKVAIQSIASGDAVMKYGIAIGKAVHDIQIGEAVHLHNCESQYDERSSNFDHKTGAVTDTIYE